MAERLYFEEIKEHHGPYFVEYHPPISDCRFATLNLVFHGGDFSANVADLMETELRHWLSRYPVSLMIWAWDSKEDMIEPDGKGGNCLVGWIDPAAGGVRQSWNSDDLTKFLNAALPDPDWRAIYVDVAVRTDAEVKADAMRKLLERGKQVRIL